MEWVIVAIAIVILGVTAAVVSGLIAVKQEDADSDTPQPYLPGGDLSAADLRGCQFGVTLRGYDMRQVDELLARLAEQLEQNPAEMEDSGKENADEPDPAVKPAEKAKA